MIPAMRIRNKLLLLLLVLALGPLSLVLWFSLSNAVRFSGEFSDRAGEIVRSAADSMLLQFVRDNGRRLQTEATSVSYALFVLSQSAGEVLLADDNAAALGRVAPPRRIGDVEVALPASLPGVHMAPGADAPALSASRLQQLGDAFALNTRTLRTPLLAQHITFPSGMQVFYPPTATRPPGYDPRRAPWYEHAVEEGGMVWTSPLTDPATGQTVMTLSAPIYTRDGELLGVCGADLRVVDVLGDVTLPVFWQRAATVMIVSLQRLGDAQYLYVVARSVSGEKMTWGTPAAAKILVPADAKVNPDELPFPHADVELSRVGDPLFEQILDDLFHERTAQRELPFDGAPALWIYGPLPGAGAALLVVVPREALLAPVRIVSSGVQAHVRTAATLAVVVIASLCVVVFVIALGASRQVTLPIQQLVDATGRIAVGDLDTQTRIVGNDEFAQLGSAVNAMLPRLRDHMRLKQGLAVAMEVQQKLLPTRTPPIVGLDVAGRSIYCDETGGDYFDFVDLSHAQPHRLGIAVGDVTGHGVGAALLMATARAHLRSVSAMPHDIGAMLQHVNRQLAHDVTPDRFMTLSYLLIDAEATTVVWSNAGHDPAFVFSDATTAPRELAGGGIPLGIDPDWDYEQEGPLALRPNDIIVLGTDGIWESRNDAGEMFGKQRLHAAVQGAWGQSAEQICDAISQAVATFRDGHPQDDDVTLVVVRVIPPPVA